MNAWCPGSSYVWTDINISPSDRWIKIQKYRLTYSLAKYLPDSVYLYQIYPPALEVFYTEVSNWQILQLCASQLLMSNLHILQLPWPGGFMKSTGFKVVLPQNSCTASRECRIFRTMSLLNKTSTLRNSSELLLPCIWSEEELYCLIPNSMKAGRAVQSFHSWVA